MVLTAFSDFVEFKNTKEGKTLQKESTKKDCFLTFAKLHAKSTGKDSVRIVLSPILVKDMEEKGITSFKLLYNEKSFNVLLKYDNSSNAFRFDKNKIRPTGSREYLDLYVSAVMLNLMEKKHCKGLVYKGKYLKDKLSYLFELCKIKKED